MNQEPTPEQRGRHARTAPTLEQLSLETEDDVLRERWEEGLSRWGNSFAAFTRLRDPALYSHDVLVTFESLYGGSYVSMDDLARQEIADLDWEIRRQQLLAAEGIPEQLLIWDYDAMAHLLQDMYEIVQEGEEIHVFVK